MMNVALFHLRRYSASVAGMRRVLQRRLFKWNKEGAEVVGEPEVLLGVVLARLETMGYLNDERLAAGKVASLRRAGASARVIGLKLFKAGVKKDLAKRATTSEGTSDSDAVWTWARRKKLGVFRTKNREERRQKDLAAIVRAGFSFRDAKAVVDAKTPPDPLDQ
jgi:regulatory protein